MGKFRGLYGQSEGNERRPDAEWLEDRLRENALVEGDWLKRMTHAAKHGEVKRLAALRDQMKAEYVAGGVSRYQAQDRADAVLRQAMNHLRV